MGDVALVGDWYVDTVFVDFGGKNSAVQRRRAADHFVVGFAAAVCEILYVSALLAGRSSRLKAHLADLGYNIYQCLVAEASLVADTLRRYRGTAAVMRGHKAVLAATWRLPTETHNRGEL